MGSSKYNYIVVLWNISAGEFDSDLDSRTEVYHVKGHQANGMRQGSWYIPDRSWNDDDDDGDEDDDNDGDDDDDIFDIA